ncbi:MAG: MOSC domain-containing protein [Fimbriimonadales bacterium]
MRGSVIEVRIKNPGVEGPTTTAERLHLTEEWGILGGEKYADARQVLLLDRSNLEAFGYEPGMLREQILVDLPSLQSLVPGTKMKVGTAELEVTSDCAPCRTMAGYVEEEGPSFVNKMMGRRGMLAKVIQDGSVSSGDAVEVIVG